MPFEIPLSNDPAQRFETELNGKRYFFTVKYNYNGDVWSFALEDSDGMIIEGMPMLLGQNMFYYSEDLIRSIGEMWMFDKRGLNEDATSENLGTDVILLHYPPGETPILPSLEDLGGIEDDEEDA